MLTGITFRRFEESDFDAFLALRLRGLREHPEGFGAMLEEELGQPREYHMNWLRRNPATPHNFILGAWEGDKLLGMASFVMETRMKQRHKGHVYGMYVVAEAQGRGIGKALLEELISRARNVPGLEILLIAVLTENRRAAHIYESCGFKLYGREPKSEKVNGRYLDLDELRLEL